MKYSAYLYINRGEDYNYPYREAISSVLWCDEVVVGSDIRFDDMTLDGLKQMRSEYSNIRLIEEEFDFDVANPHGAIKQILREECKNEWLIELDADEYFLQNQVAGLKDICEHAPPRHLAIEVPCIHFFNGNNLHQDMPPHRTLISRNVNILCHDIGKENHNGRMGAALITEKGIKVSASLRYPNLALYHYGWYSLPRKWETKQTVHYYDGRLQGVYDELEDYTVNLDEEEVNFWDIPWILPIEHYTAAIHVEMHQENLAKFRGKHPLAMIEWCNTQRVLNWQPSIRTKFAKWIESKNALRQAEIV